MGLLEEQDGVVLGISRPLPSGLACSHWSTSKDTFGSSCHIPAADMIKSRAWLDCHTSVEFFARKFCRKGLASRYRVIVYRVPLVYGKAIYCEADPT